MSTYDPHSDWPDAERIRAFLAPLNEWDAMTDEERAEAAGPHRRDVLGSLDDTHALNRNERGCTLLLPVIGLAFILLGGWGYFVGRLDVLQFVGLWILSAFALAAVVCCNNDGTRDRLDADAPKGGARR